MTPRLTAKRSRAILAIMLPVLGSGGVQAQAAWKARVMSDCAIAGVPDTGAEIIMDFFGAVGSATG